MKQNSRYGIRTLLALAAILLSLGVVGLFLPQEWLQPFMTVVVERVSLLLWAGLILLSGAAAGSALLRVTRLAPTEPLALGLFGLGTGLALISALTLLLGAVGFLDKVRLLVLLMMLLALGRRELGVLLRALPGVMKARRRRRLSWFRVSLWCVLGLFLLMNLTRAFEPQWAYDVLEYHLASPASYWSAGRIFFPAHNVYANFPQNVEMLYLVGMELTGSPERGVIVGNLIGAALGFFAALALSGMLRRLIGREGADAAAAIFYTWAGVTVYSGVAYVELPLIFYMTLALWGLIWSWRRKLTRPQATGWLFLSAIACGAAMGVKYTAALLCFVPILGWLVLLGLARRVPMKELTWRVACFILLNMLLFGPWLIRSMVNTGNPVYPLLYKVFDGRDWDAQKDARWNWAHSPRDRSLKNLVAQARDVLFFDERMASLALLLFVPLALLARRRVRTLALVLAGQCLLLFLLWFLFTQHNARFLEPGVTALAALGGIGLASALRFRQSAGLRGVTLAVLLLAPNCWVNVTYWASSFRSAAGVESQEEFFKRNEVPGYFAMQFLNDEKNLPAGSKVLFLGEARTFYCRRDFVAATVFNTNPLGEIVAQSKTPEDILSALRQQGITHLYVDSGETMRLQESYRYPYQGSTHLGMLEGFDWALFGRFAREHLRLIRSLPPKGVEQFDWAVWPQLLDQYMQGKKPGQFIGIYEIVER